MKVLSFIEKVKDFYNEQELVDSTLEQALIAAEKRLQELAQKSRRCMKATAALWAYLAE